MRGNNEKKQPEKIRGLTSIIKIYQQLTQEPLKINRKKKILYFLRSIFISQNHLSKVLPIEEITGDSIKIGSFDSIPRSPFFTVSRKAPFLNIL